MMVQLKALWASGKLMFGVAALALLVASHTAAYRAGGEGARRVVATQEAERAQATIQAFLEAFQKAGEDSAAIRKKLDALPSTHTLETIIRENPSVCVIPAPVADQLRKDIRAANQAITR